MFLCVTFSTARDVLKEHLSRLFPEYAQMLIFIKENFSRFL